MTQHTSTVPFEGVELILLEGEISHLHVDRSSADLMGTVQKSVARQDARWAATAALTAMYDALKAAPYQVSEDYDDSFNFVGVISGQVVYGSFEKADKIKNLDKVKAVGFKVGSLYSVQSLLVVKNDLLMLPTLTFAGKRAFFRSCMKVAWRCCLFIWLFFFVALYFSLDMFALRPDKLHFMAGLCFAIGLINFPLEYQTYRSMKYHALYASAIFEAHGLPRPDDLDARSGMTFYADERHGFAGINLRIALEKHRKKYRIRDQ